MWGHSQTRVEGGGCVKHLRGGGATCRCRAGGGGATHISTESLSHYTKTLKQRRALTKKGEAWSSHLRRCVTHYNVIGDAHLHASLISHYRRRVLQTLVSHHVEKLRRSHIG
jgi:hypothetical protein